MKRVIIRNSIWLNSSGSLDDLDAVRATNNGHLRKIDEKPMLHHPRDPRKRMRHRFRLVNPAECGVDDPVAAIRDESMAVLALPQIKRLGPLDLGPLDYGDCLLDRPARRGKTEWRHLDR